MSASNHLKKKKMTEEDCESTWSYMENMAEAFWTDFLDLYFADSTGRLLLGLICPVTDSTHRS